MEDEDDLDEDADDGRPPIAWNIHREGRAWTADEFDTRVGRLIELKFEVNRGKLFWSEETRRMVLGMLLENVGMDVAVRLGDLALWKAAVTAAERDAGAAT